MAAHFPRGKQPEMSVHCTGTRKLSNPVVMACLPVYPFVNRNYNNGGTFTMSSAIEKTRILTLAQRSYFPEGVN